LLKLSRRRRLASVSVSVYLRTLCPLSNAPELLAQIKEGFFSAEFCVGWAWESIDENRVGIAVACLLITRISQVAKQAQKRVN